VKALFAGSFDPIHVGHVDIIERASKLFDELHVVVASSPEKKYSIPLDSRLDLVTKSISHIKNVRVEKWTGLIVDYAKTRQVQCLIRGLRIHSDFEYEQSMDWHNHFLAPDIETICLMTRPSLRFVSSRGLKELIQHNQNVKLWLPAPVMEYLKRHRI
jgi:pantetheine-phosphate adenylyltransferase